MNDFPFPIVNKQAAAIVQGKHTEVLATYFADRILICISQFGRVGSVLQTVIDNDQQLMTSSYSPYDPSYSSSTNDMSNNIPLVSTTSQFLLGAGNSSSKKSQMYQVYASHISQMIAHQSPMENRPVVLSLALDIKDDLEGGNNTSVKEKEQRLKDRDLFEKVIELVNQCRLW